MNVLTTNTSKRLIIAILLAAGSPVFCEVPSVIEYTGRVVVDGENFTSTAGVPGCFKCSLVTGAGETLWSNQGDFIRLVEGSSEAPFAVAGRFSLRLGDESNPIDAGVLGDSSGATGRSEVFLQTWFSPDNTPDSYVQLTPDIKLASVPFAVWSAATETVKDDSIGESQLADGAVETDKLAPNAVMTPALPDGALPVVDIRPSFDQGSWSGSEPSPLSLDLETSRWAADVDFHRAFSGSPVLNIPGWTLESSGSTGFTASREGFVNTPVGVGGFHNTLAVVAGRPAIASGTPAFFGGEATFVIANDAEGQSWGAPVTLQGDYPANGGGGVAMVVAQGHPAVCFWANGNSGYVWELNYVRANDDAGSSWEEAIQIGGNLNGINDAGEISLAIIGDHPAVCYLSPINGGRELMFRRANNGTGMTTWALPVVVDSTYDVGFYNSMTIVNGHPAIAYYDRRGMRDLRFIRSDHVYGTTWGDPAVLVDSVGDVGHYASLAVVGGRPAIAYYDATNQDLKYVIADDIDGANWPSSNIVTVDSVGDVGRELSLAVIDGRAAISYRDFTNNALKFVVANDPGGTGSSWATPLVVDVRGDFTSLLAINGRPGIAHGSSFSSIPVPTGNWTASEPGLEPVLTGRAAGVTDGSVTLASLSSEVGQWSRSGSMIYRETGRVGIGTSTPAADLHVVGTAGNTTGQWTSFSDRRLKENIVPMEAGSLELLLRLEGVVFDYVPDELRQGYPHSQHGWIAQEVEKVFPEWVDEAPDGMKMVTPVGFKALAVEAFRELRSEKDAAIDGLEKVLLKMGTASQRLDDENARLERNSAALRSQGLEMERLLEQLDQLVADRDPLVEGRPAQ